MAKYSAAEFLLKTFQEPQEFRETRYLKLKIFYCNNK